MSRPDETLQRVRRIETRLVQTMVALGVDITTNKPEFIPSMEFDNSDGASIVLPSPHTSMKEVLDNIPASWDGPVGVFVGDNKVATIQKH
jgi:hypothetical protein